MLTQHLPGITARRVHHDSATSATSFDPSNCARKLLGNKLSSLASHGAVLTFWSVETADICRPGARALTVPLERLNEREAKDEDAAGATNADAQSSTAAAVTQAATTFMLQLILC